MRRARPPCQIPSSVRRALSTLQRQLLNRVSTDVGEITKVEHTMKISHVALDAV
jgi:hypothetical protein